MYLLVKIVVTSKHFLVEILVIICTLNVRSYRNIVLLNNSRVVVFLRSHNHGCENVSPKYIYEIHWLKMADQRSKSFHVSFHVVGLK